MTGELLFKDEVYAAIEVHRRLGHGFLEAVYPEAMQVELALHDIPFDAKPRWTITYRDRPLLAYYEAELICYGKILIEFKALSELSGTEEAQVLNYLKATGLRVGVLINFGRSGKLDWRRLVR